MPEPIVTLNEETLRTDLRELVRWSVEEMLDGLMDEEADDLVGAERHGRAAGREAYRAGHYERRPTTTSGEVTIRSPSSRACASPRLSSSATGAARRASRRS